MFDENKRTQPLILIVDDSINNIRILNEAVKDLGEIIFASDGATALEIVFDRRPDLILLDIEMPNINGYQVCSRIKSEPRVCDTPIIFVTGYDSEIHELQAISRGGVDFLQKPINLPVARARVQTHLALSKKTKELALTRQDLSDVVEHLPAFIAYWDAAQINRFCNDSLGRWFGVTAAAMHGQHIREVFGAFNFAAIDRHLQTALNGTNSSFELTLTSKDGELLYGQASLVCRSQDNFIDGFLLLITDITNRKLAEIELFDEKERFRVTLNSIGDAVIATDASGNITFLNPIAEDMTGWLNRDALGQPIEVVMPLIEAHLAYAIQNPIRLALLEKRIVGMAMNCVLCCRDGRRLDVEDSAAPIRDQQGNITGAIIVFHDVSEARAMAVKMSHLANHDALTNLPNRILLHDRAEQALQSAKRTGAQVGMILLDLDHFKSINDTAGHSIGDALLQQLAARLKNSLRASDTVSRQGGDEFIVLLPDLEQIKQATDIANKLLKVISEPVYINDHRYDLSVSMGISIFPTDCQDQETMYRHADSAMYRAKQEGRNRYRFFSSEIEHKLKARNLLEGSLREAVEQQHFEVHYQAKVDFSSGAIIGAEALVRWRKKDGELIFPSDFIPLAEETGLIVPLGKYVLLKACEDAKRWHDQGHMIKVSVNVSTVQFDGASFLDDVAAILTQTGIAAEWIELEITEGVLAKNHVESRQILTTLKALGLRIAIDDFGTGYSSLAYLKLFPIDVLKIDQGFIRDMLIDKNDAAIITAIINLANNLNLQLVAEGVEEYRQAVELDKQGCSIMQGYLYSRPIPFLQMSDLLVSGIKQD